MQKLLKYKATSDTPEIIFDSIENKFQIIGRSLPENPYDFYKPIIDWMTEYSKEPNSSTQIEINLEYFNSSSIKQLLQIFMVLEKIKKDGKDAKIIWYYNEDDDLNKIKGREFESILSIPFEFKAS